MGILMHSLRGNSALFLAGFFPLLSLFWSSSVRADWNPDARRDFARLEKRMENRKNGEIDGIIGAAAVEMGGLIRTMRFRRNYYRNDVDYEKDGQPLEYLVTRTGRKVSPLVVYFPGVFGDAKNSGSLMAGRQFRRARDHVILLPNPWGQNFQNAHPKFMPGDFNREAKAMLDVINEGIRFIGKDRISEIHFYGESYGGFLATATAHAMNSQGFYHVKTVASVSVPYHIGNAIAVLDGLADRDENAYFDGGCALTMNHLFEIVGFVYELIATPRTSEIYGRHGMACSSAIFSYSGFEQPLFQLSKSLAARSRSAEWLSKPESYWERKIRFRVFGEMFFGTSIDKILSKNSATLSYWLKKIRGEGTQPLALIANDDPLNPPPGVGSHKVINSYAPNEILVLSQGGHLGFRGNNCFKRLLRDQYRFTAPEDDSDQPDNALDNDPQVASDEFTADDEES